MKGGKFRKNDVVAYGLNSNPTGYLPNSGIGIVHPRPKDCPEKDEFTWVELELNDIWPMFRTELIKIGRL